MAVKQSIIIASAFLLVLLVNEGLAINCIECNSHYNQDCETDNAVRNYTVDCQSKFETDEEGKRIEFTFCRKISQIIEFSVNQLPANTRIIRSCGYDKRNYVNSCYKRHGFGGRQIVCACDDKDNCNSSTTLQSAMVLVTLLAGVMLHISL